jgi:hypothetical protein
VLELVRRRPDQPWHARDINGLLGFHPIPALQELVARRLLVQVDAWRWKLAKPRPTRLLQTGQTLHRIGIELPASSEWADTDLQPDVLGTRPLLAGMTIRLLWQAVVDPRAEVMPIVLLRHVPDPSRASRDNTFTYVPPDDRVAITPSLAEVRFAPSAWFRFPREPGRIEARIAGASGPSELFAVAGTIRLEFHAHVAGEADFPVRPDHVVRVVGSNEFPDFPELPANAEPIAWHSFV